MTESQNENSNGLPKAASKNSLQWHFKCYSEGPVFHSLCYQSIWLPQWSLSCHWPPGWLQMIVTQGSTMSNFSWYSIQLLLASFCDLFPLISTSVFYNNLLKSHAFILYATAMPCSWGAGIEVQGIMQYASYWLCPPALEFQLWLLRNYITKGQGEIINHNR